MTRAKVDLPQPDSPMIPTVCPRCTLRFTSRSTLTATEPSIRLP